MALKFLTLLKHLQLEQEAYLHARDDGHGHGVGEVRLQQRGRNHSQRNFTRNRIKLILKRKKTF